MKLNSIFDICLNAGMLSLDWDDKKSDHLEEVKEYEKLLIDNLDENQKKLFHSFRWKLVSHLFSIRDEECMDTFLLGYKFGKELQTIENEEN